MQESIVSATLTLLHPLIREWIPYPSLHKAVEKDVRESLSLVDNDEFATGFQNAVPLPGVPASAYRIRMLEIEPDHHVIAGIRFRPDPAMAFVHVYARDFELTTNSQVLSLCETLHGCFETFEPDYMRVSTAVDSSEEAILGEFPGTTDFLTVAAPVTFLQQQPSPEHLECIHLQHASWPECFERYSRAYDEFHLSSPQLRYLVPKASKSTLEQCASEGMLFDVEVDGNWAGLIAGRLQTEFGMSGVRMVEEVLASPYRSTGLGPALQRRFIDLLPNEAENIVHGAIHPENLASLKTAMRVGRQPVMRTTLLAM